MDPSFRKSAVIHNLPLRRHKETQGDQSAIIENQQPICSQKDNDFGVISIQNSRGPHAEVADRRNVITRLRSGFGCEDRSSRCNKAEPSPTKIMLQAHGRGHKSATANSSSSTPASSVLKAWFPRRSMHLMRQETAAYGARPKRLIAKSSSSSAGPTRKERGRTLERSRSAISPMKARSSMQAA
jgi:hypothetical protein